MAAPKRKSKYGTHKKIEFDGQKFDSKPEIKEYIDLKWREKAGEINNLKHSVRFDLWVNGIKIGYYLADFSYKDLDDNLNVVEVKSFITSKEKYYRLKNRLFLALYPKVIFRESVY